MLFLITYFIVINSVAMYVSKFNNDFNNGELRNSVFRPIIIITAGIAIMNVFKMKTKNNTTVDFKSG